MPCSRTLALAAALTLAGCGTPAGGHQASASGSLDAAGVESLYRRLTGCFRAHGVPGFPDPVRDPATGRWEPAVRASRPPPTALAACKTLSEQVARVARNTPVTAADLAALRAFGACMRARGVPDWPEVGDDGVFVLPPRLAKAGEKQVKSQIAACDRDLPLRGFRVTPRR